MESQNGKSKQPVKHFTQLIIFGKTQQQLKISELKLNLAFPIHAYDQDLVVDITLLCIFETSVCA